MLEQGIEPVSTNPDLRPIVCVGLKTLVESLIKLSKTTEDVFVQRQIGSGLQVLSALSTGFMAMLCNNYTSPDLGLIEKLVEQITTQSKQATLSKNGVVASAKNIVLQTVHEKENQKCELAIKAFLDIADQQVCTDSYKGYRPVLYGSCKSFTRVSTRF